MAEKVSVWQNSQLQTKFMASDPEVEDGSLQEVAHIHALTPYGMMLASLGACTAIVMNTYAQNHGLDLKEVELRLHYERDFDAHETRQANPADFEERITEQIDLHGNLDDDERDKLFRIAKQCSIHRMYERGIAIHSELANGAGNGQPEHVLQDESQEGGL